MSVQTPGIIDALLASDAPAMEFPLSPAYDYPAGVRTPEDDETEPEAVRRIIAVAQKTTEGFLDFLKHTALDNGMTSLFAGGLVRMIRQNGIPTDAFESPASGVGVNTEAAIKSLRAIPRDVLIHLLAPAFIYARTGVPVHHLNSHEHDSLNLLDTMEYEGEDNLSAELIDSDRAEVVLGRFVPGLSVNSPALEITSDGVIFRHGGEIRWYMFDAPRELTPLKQEVATRELINTPDSLNADPDILARYALFRRLVRELRAQSDLELVVIALRLFVGVEAMSHEEDGQRQLLLLHQLLDAWSELFPDEPTDAPIFASASTA